MKVQASELAGVLAIEPRVFQDPRGYFLETYQARRYREEAGLAPVFVQDNLSHSVRGVLRGLHYQLGHPQGKLVTAVAGTIFDVAADIRVGSPTFGRWTGLRLRAEAGTQLFVPPGFAHGFLVLSETATVLYKCTDYYSPAEERGIRWDDPRLAIAWPGDAPPLLSNKDQSYPLLAEVAPEQLPRYPGGSRS